MPSGSIEQDGYSIEFWRHLGTSTASYFSNIFNDIMNIK